MENEKNNGSEEQDVNLPPINLPPPDKFDTSRGSAASKKKKRKKKKMSRNHPTDSYKDHRKPASGCCSAIGCFGFFALILVLAVAGGVGWFFLPFKSGYTFLRIDEPEIVITDAPDEATVFVAPQSTVRYEAPTTTVPLGIVAKEVELSGSFLEDVTIRASQVTCRSEGTYSKNLDVYAVEFVNEGITVEGEMKGKSMR